MTEIVAKNLTGMTGGLVKYEAACKALAEAVSVDEVIGVLDVSVAMKLLARRAKNEEMEAQAIQIRMDATRRLGQLMKQQKEMIGLAKGGRPPSENRVENNQVSAKQSEPVFEDTESPTFIFTLSQAGIDKNLAQEARNLERLSAEEYKERVQSALDKSRRTIKNVVAGVSKAEKAAEEERKKREKERKERKRAEEEEQKRKEQEEIDVKKEEHRKFIESLKAAARNATSSATSADNGRQGLGLQDVRDSDKTVGKNPPVSDQISDTGSPNVTSEPGKQVDRQPSKTEVGSELKSETTPEPNSRITSFLGAIRSVLAMVDDPALWPKTSLAEVAQKWLRSACIRARDILEAKATQENATREDKDTTRH
jgi:hypothetical protein